MFTRGRRIKIWSVVLMIGVLFTSASLVMAEPKIKLLPPGVPNPDVDFSGITIGAIHDAGAGRILEWYAPLLEKECGVKIRRTEMVDLQKLREKAIGDLIAGKPSWELVEITPKFIADFVLTGLIEPLNHYFAKYDEEQVQAYWDDLLPIYKEFYCRWGGKTWTIPFDGDIHLFNYSKVPHKGELSYLLGGSAPKIPKVQYPFFIFPFWLPCLTRARNSCFFEYSLDISDKSRARTVSSFIQYLALPEVSCR